jgi:hypothetical protein
MANALPSAAPAHAIKVWADDVNVYAEVSSLHAPCVIAYPYTEGGLAKMLSLLGAKHTADAGGEPYLRPAAISKAFHREGLTQKELTSARQALIDLGILK